MRMVFTIIFILLVVVALLLQSTALSRRAAFTASVLLTLGLSGLLWMNHGNYLVVAIAFFMLLADISAYFFGRSFALLAPRENAPTQITKLYRSAVIFFLACWTLGLSSIIWNTNIEVISNSAKGEAAIQGLHDLVWQDGFLYIAACSILVLVCAFGIFFMAKKDS